MMHVHSNCPLKILTANTKRINNKQLLIFEPFIYHVYTMFIFFTLTVHIILNLVENEKKNV